MTLFVILILHVVRPNSAFSNVPSRSFSHFGVNDARRLRPPTSRSFTVFKSSTYLAAAADDSDESLQINQTATNSTGSEEGVDDDNSVDKTKKGVFGKIFGGRKKFNKASLAKLGGSVLLSYGFVSNVFGITCVNCAWYIASKKVRRISARVAKCVSW